MKNSNAMRTFKILAVALTLSFVAQATPLFEGEEIYLDVRMEVVKNKKNAAYYCLLEEETERGFLFKAYFISGELKMEGYYSDREMMIAHGEFKYYYRSGKLESIGEFREGGKYGIWQRFDEDGTEKPEKIYASQPMLKALAKEKADRKGK